MTEEEKHRRSLERSVQRLLQPEPASVGKYRLPQISFMAQANQILFLEK